MPHPDNRTLGEIYQDDTEMTEHKLKKAARYDLFNWRQAREFQWAALFQAFKLVGIDPGLIERCKSRRLDELFETKGIRVENRTYSQFENWKKGLYIYRKDEDGTHGDLAYFVSDIFPIKANPILRPTNVIGMRFGSKDNTAKYFIMTNVPMDSTPKHFVMPMIGG